MSQASSVAFAVVDGDNHVPARANVSLKGTTRGLEILISGTPSTAALAARLTELLAEAPSFFAGSDARVAFEAALPAGALACLEEVATRFELKIVEIGPVARRPRTYAAVVRRADDSRRRELAEGTGPIADQGRASDGARAAGAEAAPTTGAPSDGTPAVAVAAASVEAAAPVAPAATDDAAPIEIALANTAPYSALTISETLSESDPSASADPLCATDRDQGAAASSTALTAESAGELAVADALATATSFGGTADAATCAPPALIEAAGLAPAGLAPEEAAVIEAALACAVTIQAPAPGAGVSSIAPGAAPSAASEAVTPVELGAKAARTAGAEPSAGPTTQAMAAVASAGEPDIAPPGAALTTGAAIDPAAVAAEIEAAAAALAAELVAAMPPGPRLVIGPVRSGVIVDHTGHVIVIGDVNPGAEVRAEGSIIVLGRLRGVAHAAIGRDAGAIIALSFQPQQLRIGRMVARAADADRPSGGAEIAYVTGETIVVERFTGRLPSGLAASM